MKGARHFTVSFDIKCRGKAPCSGDIRDALGQFFERDVLRGVVSNFDVRINHAKEQAQIPNAPNSRSARDKQEPR